MMPPRPAAVILDQNFLDARCRLLDLAAILDRIDRGADATALATDPRMVRIQAALRVLASDEPGRAERVQQIFSQPYDPDWTPPAPR
jgi:hypothetical protein